ncbi:MAG: hypothetical protein CM15mP93_17580 [Thiotrichaceae bacterium]|nr:MAG: hypothetical protein CM15mP93_17580 [Thiotrichaceae bacterium]
MSSIISGLLAVFPVEENVSENELLKSRAHASLKVIMTKNLLVTLSLIPNV